MPGPDASDTSSSVSLSGNILDKGAFWWLYCYLLIPAVILIIGAAPGGFRDNWLIFDLGAPTLVSAFFSNYTHSTIGHLSGNLLLYLAAITLVCALESRKKTFCSATLLFTLLLPFVVSGVTYLFLSPLSSDIPPTQGFSGITAAFFGYALYLVALLLYETTVLPWVGRWRDLDPMLQALAALQVVLIALLVAVFCNFGYSWGAFEVDGGVLSNGVAHFTGFMAGVIVPLGLGIAGRREGYLVFYGIFILYLALIMVKYGFYLAGIAGW